ncbi:MAG: tyrosine-type recombinase/integrase [Bacillota bacterium]|nr:tyrosine-type recombinase/integrase [Bacillota bacterium]
MTNFKFGNLLSNYFLKHIPERKNYSENTIKSYRDSFILFFEFCKKETQIKIEKLTLDKINNKLIEAFLYWLEKDKKYSIASVNQRLAAIKAFYRFVASENPELLKYCSSILTIKSKKVEIKPMNYLSINAIEKLLNAPDINSKYGIRNKALLTLLYDSGARVQEIADLEIHDLKLNNHSTVKLKGKGNKTRIVPIMPQSTLILTNYLENENWFNKDKNSGLLFFNKSNNKLTRAGISYILSKYVKILKKEYPEIFSIKISPHTLRHSKAMHLLEAGVNLIYIRDFLGHVSVITTEIYAKVNPEIKRKAIEKAAYQFSSETKYSKKEKNDLLEWLKDMI